MIVHKLIMSVFKDFEINIVVDVGYRLNVDSLPLLPLTFADLLADVCYAVYSA